MPRTWSKKVPNFNPNLSLIMTPHLSLPAIMSKSACAALLALAVASNAQAQNITASDNASATNYPGATWNATTNGGTGFGAWSLPGSPGTGGFNGNFIGTGGNLTNYSSLYSGGVAFSIYAGGNGSAFQDALRPFASAMSLGQTLSFSIGISFDNGNKGFDLNSGADGSSGVFNFNISDQGYRWTGNGSAPMTTFAGIRENGVVINFSFTRTSTGFSYTINSTQDPGLTQSGNITAAGLGSLKYYISGAGGGDPGNLFFNNLQIAGDPAPVGNRTVTFNVDMSVQESLGNFNSSNGSVIVVGTFNDWNTGNGVTLSNTGNGVYSGNGSIFGAEGSTITYKFFNTTPGAPNDGYESSDDRSLTLGPIDQSQNVPVVYFSNVLPSRVVNFSVNMTEQIALGNFNATTGNVSVVGEFNGWDTGSGISLSNSGDGIYTGNGSISGAQGSSVAYKFYNSTPNAPNFGYEAGAERSLTLGAPGTPQSEPLVSFRIPAPPTITSAATQNGTVGTSLAYQITTSPSAEEWSASFALTGNTTLPDGLALNTSTGFINGTPTAAGNTTVQIQATNVGGAGNSTSLTFVIAESSGGYSDWASSYSLTGNNSLPTADPDSDSFTNEQEYAFGTNPTQATAGLLTSSTSGGNLTVTFLTRSNLTYNVQTTDNLSTTAFSNNGDVTVSDGPVLPDPPEGYIRKQFTIVPSGSRNFYRVVASE
jgi:hypothetical protein